MKDLGRRGLLTTAASALFAPRTGRAQDNSLIITTYGGSWETFWREQIVPRFVARTGASVSLDVGFGRTFSSALRAAGPGGTDYSVLMMNDIFVEPLCTGGNFEKLDMDLLPHACNLYDVAYAEHGMALTAMISPIGIGYRTDLVKTPPSCWRDLWTNPEFRGRIGLYNVQNSVGKAFVCLAGRLFGKGPEDMDGAFSALVRLGPVLQTDFNMSTMMGTGEIVVAPFDFGEIARLRRQGLPVDCVMPQEGMLMWDQTFTICAQARSRTLAYRYLDFIFEPEIQLMLAETFFVSPVSRAVKIPPSLAKDVPVTGDHMASIISTDWHWANENAATLDARWSHVFG
ncbi:putative spermidine/putrescine transport system substrate-binding protein [Acetobacter senegalensis]|uniref:Putative spermidine/putrescine transport system substrate-binding protein n=1 Tax=Acetobacter senegalensis TaxID=446692 RepID=A0A0U5ESN2_9PROT|nr:extracellular solute-binding protein [Acetobacter senegalensis]CEF40682.1 putative spermidine/putrescine transport system substrate-binding protein [Acetobacter senegalensis]